MIEKFSGNKRAMAEVLFYVIVAVIVLVVVVAGIIILFKRDISFMEFIKNLFVFRK